VYVGKIIIFLFYWNLTFVLSSALSHQISRGSVHSTVAAAWRKVVEIYHATLTKFWTFCAPVSAPFADHSQIWRARVDWSRPIVSRKFHLDMGEKPLLAERWVFGDFYTIPFTDQGHIWRARVDHQSNFIWICLLRRLSDPKLYRIFNFNILGGAMQRRRDKNSSGDETANVNFYAVRPGSYPNSLK